MPLIERACPNGHVTEQYRAHERCLIQLRDCGECGEPVYIPVFTTGRALTYFRENNAQVIANLDPNTPIRSHEHHKRVMKERGVEPLTDWHTSMKRSRM